MTLHRLLLASCALGLLVGLPATASASEYVNGPGDDPVCIREVTLPELGAPIYRDRDGGVGVMTSQSTDPPQTTYEVLYTKDCPAVTVVEKCNDLWRGYGIEAKIPDISAICALISGP